jgi:hypothetical protein
VNDDELRALVRDAVRRHTAPVATPSAALPQAAPATRAQAAEVRAATGIASISHALYLTLVNPGDACLIEPAVPCNHCGFCQTHGH